MGLVNRTKKPGMIPKKQKIVASQSAVKIKTTPQVLMPHRSFNVKTDGMISPKRNVKK